MNESLLVAGIVCVVASIVGGGIKLLGAEVPMLSSFPRQALLFGVGLSFLAASYILGAGSPPQATRKAGGNSDADSTAAGAPGTTLSSKDSRSVGSESQTSSPSPPKSAAAAETPKAVPAVKKPKKPRISPNDEKRQNRQDAESQSSNEPVPKSTYKTPQISDVGASDKNPPSKAGCYSITVPGNVVNGVYQYPKTTQICP